MGLGPGLYNISETNFRKTPRPLFITLLKLNFLALTQSSKSQSFCLCVCPSMIFVNSSLNLYDSCSDLQAVLTAVSYTPALSHDQVLKQDQVVVNRCDSQFEFASFSQHPKHPKVPKRTQKIPKAPNSTQSSPKAHKSTYPKAPNSTQKHPKVKFLKFFKSF